MSSSTNLEFYEQLWSASHLEEPERFNTWPLMRELAESAPRRLEVGPGLRPRLPLEATCFADRSRRALERLGRRAAGAVEAEITALPFRDRCFDLVAAFDVIEHVADDESVFGEMGRVLKDEGVLVFSVPLHARLWTEFDAVVGHCRRYEPDALSRLIDEKGFVLESSAVYGMQPKSRLLLDIGARMLQKHRTVALRWYNRFLLPLGLRMQKPLRLERGVMRTENVDETLLVCRRKPRARAGAPSA